MNERTCYFYHRPNNSKFGVTVAYKRNLVENAVIFGAAFCRKGDQFSKKRGRTIATGRLSTVPSAIALPNDPEGTPRFDVHSMILSYLENVCDYAPQTFGDEA
jgi:hypothetical protein